LRAVDLEITREISDTALAHRFDGEPMVQSFRVGRSGRVWITTAEALTVPGFGRPWVAARLTELREQMGARAFDRALRSGLRLHAGEPAALPLAA
jgi:hypothetical protein